ncbi:MAG: hypothetical protein HY527_10710 [Betaproteobacteria bacterium]|nr:hypothetical protein [Betaproteobacteria bacterium]
MRTRLTIFVSGIIVTLLAAGAFAAELGTQKSADRGVTMAITPQNLVAGAKSWNFKVVLDTHSGELNDDLVKTATLLDDKGGRLAPVKWEGAGPGGHHREGTLQFDPVTPTPSAIELRVQRPGEPAPRSFRWQLK